MIRGDKILRYCMGGDMTRSPWDRWDQVVQPSDHWDVPVYGCNRHRITDMALSHVSIGPAYVPACPH